MNSANFLVKSSRTLYFHEDAGDAMDAGTRGREDAFLKKSLAKNFLEMIRVVCIWCIWINKLWFVEEFISMLARNDKVRANILLQIVIYRGVYLLCFLWLRASFASACHPERSHKEKIKLLSSYFPLWRSRTFWETRYESSKKRRTERKRSEEGIYFDLLLSLLCLKLTLPQQYKSNTCAKKVIESR